MNIRRVSAFVLLCMLLLAVFGTPDAARSNEPAEGTSAKQGTKPLTVMARDLTLEGFAPYGSFVNILNPPAGAPRIGLGPIEFFPDMIQAHFGTSTTVSFSLCRDRKRPLVIDALECHSRTCECMMPLDGDMLLQVAPAAPRGEVPLDKIEVFRVPKGTLVVMRPGTWHHGPFAVDSDIVNILVVLPERTYANDSEVYEIPEQQRIIIALE